MKIIILKEKHSDVYFEWSDDKNIQEIIAFRILLRREMNDYFNDEEIEKLDIINSENKCLEFLYSRKNYEYEDYEIHEVTKIH